ncbi:MAG: sensor histidine kinase [Sulfuricurvum sp.]|uniref:sensor histidine kinase n=1 Tax=Sulfuricurvum sp. TaxID=2025608 RepID=UPI002609C537|nr:sensor histidine kinase [Sulfuricurvum sp.]MDD2829331.1 sensor histidine kinase [Sulfuricurvum sp.]MDD4948648.1 sensor histidine kinase [Sulfuricurvum sp.]
MHYLGWFFLLFAISINAKTLILNSEPSYDLAPYVNYLEDPHRDLNLSSVLESPFKESTKNSINFGFTHSAYWFKITLDRTDNEASKKWWLSIAYPLLEKIDIYLLSSNNSVVEHNVLGSSVALLDQQLSLHNFLTELKLGQNENMTLLLRVQTQGSMQVPLTIYSSQGYFEEGEYTNLIIGIFYGIFVVIFLYNIILYFYTRDDNYIRYLLFLTTFILWQLSFDGIGRTYLWSQSSWMIEYGPGFWIAFSAFTSLCFGKRFLQTKDNAPKVDVVIKIMMGLSLIMTAVSAILPYSKTIVINATLVILVPVLLLISGIVVMNKTHRIARFYLAGWSSFLVGTIIFAFNKFELIPSFYGVNHVQQIGAAIEMVFLSWALADRVFRLQLEYIDKLNNLNDTLSQKVTESLAEVRKKDELFVQQSRFAALGEMIEQIAHQWRQPLNTLSLINQNLYFKRQLGGCSEECCDESHEQFQEHLQYMSKTIDDFRNYYKMDKRKVAEDMTEIANIALRLSAVLLNDAKIKWRVDSQTSQKVVLAKNEMIQVFMNLIKNGHDAILERHISSAEIIITIFESGEFLEVWVEDNGGGVDEAIMDKIFTIYFTTKPSSQGTGLGLHMCKYIIEESFGGTIGVENSSKGARFIIRLPLNNDENNKEE